MNALSLGGAFGHQAGLRQLLNTRGPQWLTIILGLVVAVQLGLLVTSIGSDPLPDLRAGNAIANSTPAARSLDLAGLINAHLFGEPAAVPGSLDNNAPQTSASLVLAGVLAADDPQRGVALIGQSAAATKVYAVGDSLPGGMKLHAVYSDKVLLNRGGSIESLPLPRQRSGSLTAPPPSANALQMTPNPVVNQMRQLVTQNPAAVGQLIRPQPVFSQGKQVGVRVYPGGNSRAFFQLGLRPGDLVTAINGTTLDDPARSDEIFRTIESSSQVEVAVTRNGRQQQLTLNMSDIANSAQELANSAANDQSAANPDPPPGPSDAPVQ
ncbi:MAG: type II secretion system protein GspC [Steroidobacteraceae bacterium]